MDVDESSLTGETVPLRKNTETLPAASKVAVADRKNIAYMGTLVRYVSQLYEILF